MGNLYSKGLVHAMLAINYRVVDTIAEQAPLSGQMRRRFGFG
jgi:hypothetical protein